MLRAWQNQTAFTLTAQTSGAANFFMSRPAATQSARDAAQENASTSTCDCRMRSVKIRPAAKRLSENRKAHARLRLAKTAVNTVAGNAPGITAGARTGRAGTGARITWAQLPPALCEHRSAKSASCSAFRTTRNAHAWRCWNVTAGFASCAESSAIESTSAIQKQGDQIRATQSTITSCHLRWPTVPVMSFLTPSAFAVNATIRNATARAGSCVWTLKDR